MRACVSLALTAIALLAALTPGQADLTETAPGVFEESFADDPLTGWRVDEKEAQQATRVPARVERTTDGGNSVLHLVGGGFHNRLFYQDQRFGDFVLECRLKKTKGSYAGLVVREHWRVYLQMKCFLALNTDLKGLQSKGELAKSGTNYPGYHTLRIVCAGPLLHVFVDDQPVFQRTIPVGEGRIGLYAHGGGEAYYDHLRLDTHVPPHYYVAVQPTAPEDCLVFSPNEPVRLDVIVSNHARAKQTVALRAALKQWTGEAVKEGDEQQLAASAGGTATAAFAFGRVPAGFYRVEVRGMCQGQPVCEITDLPLAVQDRGTGRFQPPTIPLAAYSKYYNKTTPLYVKTYAHALARSLSDHHFNAVVADPSFSPEVIDLYQSYGIATIARGSFLDHPAVLATLADDEPKPEDLPRLKAQYETLQQTTGKPVTTCLVGEGMGLGLDNDPVQIWKQLQPTLRCFRWYGIKKSFYGPLHGCQYKGWLPLPSVLRVAEACSDTPYWFVAPALGKSDHESYFHKPTPAETTAVMHLALSYGADGILFWALQSHLGQPCFLDQQSLAPTDGNYAAAAAVAAQVQKHADLLHNLQLGGLDLRCPSPVVDARPLRDARDGSVYMYVVNKDARNPVTTRLLLWAERWALTKAQDVYSGQTFAVEPDDEGYLTLPVTLAPGQGMLLASDVQDRAAKKK